MGGISKTRVKGEKKLLLKSVGNRKKLDSLCWVLPLLTKEWCWSVVLSGSVIL